MKQPTKNVLLVAGFILVLILGYHYSFSKTFEVKKDLNDLKKQVEKNSRSFQNINSLEEKVAQFDSFIAMNRVENTSLQNNLLKVLNEHAGEKSFKIINFKEPHVEANDKSIVTSFQFTLEGDYMAVQEVLYKLEKEYSFGSLTHISFERKKDYRLKKNFLHCTVLVQNIQ